MHTLRLVGCRVECASGPAIAADRLVASVLELKRRRSSVMGAPCGRPAGARLGGLYCDGATPCNESGPAHRADSLRVDQDVLLKKLEGKEVKPFEAVGACEDGAVCLRGARMIDSSVSTPNCQRLGTCASSGQPAGRSARVPPRRLRGRGGRTRNGAVERLDAPSGTRPLVPG